MSNTAPSPPSVLTTKGYAVLKSAMTPQRTAVMQKTLTVSPVVPPAYAGKVESFKVFLESPTRWYLPRAWAERELGPAAGDALPDGDALRRELVFVGKPRDHQVSAIKAFKEANSCGILCLPCGYGKTFTAIAIAAALGRRFLVVVHKEFLLDQWSGELQTLLPGIRIGRIQGERCDVGPEFDVSIAMIQTICSRSYPSGVFSGFGLAVFDEAHHLGAEHFSRTLQRIQCRAMLGLTATPKRADGLTKVFEWFLGPIVFQIAKRDADTSVRVEGLRFTAAEDEYAVAPRDWKGDIVRARMINQIAAFGPRTEAILDWVHGHLEAEPARKLLVLSDRREHLCAFEAGFKQRGHTSIGYYVGGMKQKVLDVSAEARIILATFSMAAEAMNIPALNTILLSTPKSNVEQSVGRILRQRPEERAAAPLILDVLDMPFPECMGQWRKRSKFYKSCGYKIDWFKGGEGDGVGVSEAEDIGEEDDVESVSEAEMSGSVGKGGAAKQRQTKAKTKQKVCEILEDDGKTCCTSVCPECLRV